MSKDSRYARNTKSSWKSTNSCCFRRLWPNPCCCFWKIKGFDLFLPAIVTLVALELEEVDHRNVFRKFFLKAFMPGHLIFGRLHAMENHLWADSNRKAEKAEQTSNEWIHCTSRPDLHILTIWKFSPPNCCFGPGLSACQNSLKSIICLCSTCCSQIGRNRNYFPVKFLQEKAKGACWTANRE